MKITIVFVLLSVNYGKSSQDDCPVGHYRCRSSAKKCIPLDAVCDGIKDCPKGEDEMTSYCRESETEKNYKNYNPGKNYVREADKYVGSRTTSVKHVANDDHNEHYGNTGCSAGHYHCNGTINICIKLKALCDGVQDCPQEDDEDIDVCEKWQTKPPKEWSRPVNAVITDESSGNREDFGGTGFMFHVDNLIIYNSEVKMFNQNSDNQDDDNN